MPKFECGDLIVCIDDKGSTLAKNGRIYVVKNNDIQESILVQYKDHPQMFWSWERRFVKSNGLTRIEKLIYNIEENP